MTPADTPKTELERQERILKAVELRRRGKSYPEIAEDLGCALSTAFSYVQKHYKDLAKLATEELDIVRAQELARIDHWLDLIEKRLERADVFEVDRETGAAYFEVDVAKLVLAGAKLQERRAKLLGLDAPTKVETKDTTDRYDEMGPSERIALHEKAIEEERAKLAETRH